MNRLQKPTISDSFSISHYHYSDLQHLPKVVVARLTILKIPSLLAVAAYSFILSHAAAFSRHSPLSLLPVKRTAIMSSASSETPFVNASETGEIPSFNGDAKAKATDYANYFCSYSQLYHQKQMLADHNRMAAYHSAIMGNQDVFKDKVVMDVGTGSGILAVWAAQAGARKVYAIEYTDMAKHARTVMEANKVDHIVTVIQGAVEDVVLPLEKDELQVEAGNTDGEGSQQVVDIIISEWMGYFLLRESMTDSLVRARDRFMKKSTGLMMPSHTTMFVAPVNDENERKHSANDYAAAMSDFDEFAKTTSQVYGVDMNVLEKEFDREQKDYFLLSSKWTELPSEAVLAEPKMLKHLDMHTCTIADVRGIDASKDSEFDFSVNGDEVAGPISGFAGWFTADFRSRTDAAGVDTAPKILHPSFLSTGPENGYTHWGQQTFYFLNSIPLLKGETTRVTGGLEMMRTKENSRMYNCKINYTSSRRRSDAGVDGPVLMKSAKVDQVYQIP
jgi:protein arginine N-methyltransferase 1